MAKTKMAREQDPAYNIARIFTEMELDLVRNLKRHYTSHQNNMKKQGFEWEQWQAVKLRNLKKYRAENQAIIWGHDRKIKKLTREMIEDGFNDGGRMTDKFLRKVSKILPVNITNVDDGTFFTMNEGKINAMIRSVENDFAKQEHAILRQMDDVYRKTMFETQVHLASGTQTIGQAIDSATRNFLAQGITAIPYANGRMVNIRSYAEMAARTALQRATFAGGGAKRDEWGIHTVVVSSHMNSSPLCLPWQGKVYIDDVYSGGSAGTDSKYTALSVAIKAGLFHPNCRHNMSTFFEGINSTPEKADDKQALENYNQEQKQRYIERQIREWKRREAGAVDPSTQAKAAAKVSQWGKTMKLHINKNEHLSRRYSREKI